MYNAIFRYKLLLGKAPPWRTHFEGRYELTTKKVVRIERKKKELTNEYSGNNNNTRENSEYEMK